MYILSNANIDYTNMMAPDDPNNPQFIFSFTDSIIFAYRMALGDFDTSKLGDVHKWIAIIFFIMATMFLTIIMLNLLIAVISDTYARVESTSVSEMYKTFADLMTENEYLVPNSDLAEHDEQGDYMYIAILDNTNDAGNEVDNKIQKIKTEIISKTKHIEHILKDS